MGKQLNNARLISITPAIEGTWPLAAVGNDFAAQAYSPRRVSKGKRKGDVKHLR